MKRSLLFLIGLLISIHGFGQQYQPYYNWAFGFRAGATGGTSGVTIKGFVSETVAVEGIMGYWHGGPSGTILLEKYIPAFRTRGLNWFVGGGGHYTSQTGYDRWYIVKQRTYDYDDGGSSYGIDAIAGIEYKIPVAPIAISFDFKPTMDFASHGGFAVALDPGLGIKLAF